MEAWREVNVDASMERDYWDQGHYDQWRYCRDQAYAREEVLLKACLRATNILADPKTDIPTMSPEMPYTPEVQKFSEILSCGAREVSASTDRSGFLNFATPRCSDGDFGDHKEMARDVAFVWSFKLAGGSDPSNPGGDEWDEEALSVGLNHLLPRPPVYWFSGYDG
jgi:hypothetical protein